MSGRTTRFRTVLLVALCVVSLFAAPATAVATPENPFGGDSTDGTTAGDGIGDTLDGSGDTTSSNDSQDTGSTTDSDSGSGSADSSDSTSADSEDGSTADADSTDSTDSDSTTLSGSDDDGSADTGTDSEDDAGSTADSGDSPSDSDEDSLLSPLAASVNTTVGSTTDTVEDTTDTDSSDWSSLDDRADATEPTSVDWATLDDTVTSTLSGTDADPALDADWAEAPLSESTQRTASSTGTLSGSLSGTTAVVTDRVLTGVRAVVDVESVDGATGDVAGPDVAATVSTAPADGEAAPTGPADTDARPPEQSALVPADGLVDTGTSLGTAGGTGTPLPADPSPTTGFAVGLGGVAALAAVRQGLFTTAGTGVAGTASAVAASVTPALTGRSSALDRLVRMLTAFRYSRYDDSDPLEHEARADVFDVVEETPGAYLSEVAERADLPLSTARHHVRVLEREDLLMGAKVRGKRRFYPAYTGDIELAAALNDDSTAVVLDALARLGGSSVSALADELGRDPSTVTHHLQRLEEDGLVVREREGRAVINRLAAAARTALEPETEAAVAAEASSAMASD